MHPKYHFRKSWEKKANDQLWVCKKTSLHCINWRNGHCMSRPQAPLALPPAFFQLPWRHGTSRALAGVPRCGIHPRNAAPGVGVTAVAACSCHSWTKWRLRMTKRVPRCQSLHFLKFFGYMTLLSLEYHRHSSLQQQAHVSSWSSTLSFSSSSSSSWSLASLWHIACDALLQYILLLIVTNTLTYCFWDRLIIAQMEAWYSMPCENACVGLLAIPNASPVSRAACLTRTVSCALWPSLEPLWMLPTQYASCTQCSKTATVTRWYGQPNDLMVVE